MLSIYFNCSFQGCVENFGVNIAYLKKIDFLNILIDKYMH